MGINPIEATKAIDQNYLNYLTTSFWLKHPVLREQLQKKLSEEFRLVKGPILQATPSFKAGASLKTLIDLGIISQEFHKLSSPDLPLDRFLFLHQETAIKKMIQGRRNIVVATGTGSGKTEAFILPILNHLFREVEKGSLTPGVRALLLYPMNALANDQMSRLRKLLQNYQGITFGRYTGETERKTSAAASKYWQMFEREPLPNELISRDQMWDQPPHILLTNYAMLDYLLLRPDDNVFFQNGQQWRFVVIDEAHTYTGAKGIETAMLLRRLKERITQGKKGQLQCVATSATLGRGREDYPAIIRWARQLFGESFEWVDQDIKRQDIVEATCLPLRSNVISGRFKPHPRLYIRLREAIQKGIHEDLLDQLRQVARSEGVPNQLVREAGTRQDKDWQQFLHDLLQADDNLLRAQELLQDGPKQFNELVEALDLKTAGDEQAVVALVDLANQARPGPGSQPLLPARYHVFARAVEGAYVSLGPKPQLFLERRESFQVDGQEYKVFEIASCVQCGALYLVGPWGQGPNSDRSAPQFFLVVDRELNADEWDEDDAVEYPLDSAGYDPRNYYLLCARCGAIDRKDTVGQICACGQEYKVRLLHVKSKDGEIHLCPGCGKRSPAGLVRRFFVGTDAAASVLSTVLFQKIEPQPQKQEQPVVVIEEDEWGSPDADLADDAKAADGNRKLLIFSDNRQDAAFFAPYLNKTYDQILRRHLLLKTLEKHKAAIAENGWRLLDLAKHLRFVAEEAGCFPDLSRQGRLDTVWKWIIYEFLGFERRIGLEGMGLLGFLPVMPEGWIPKALMRDPWNLSPEEIKTMFSVFLNNIRTKGAILFPDQVSPRDEFFAPRNRELFIRGNGAVPPKGILSWKSQGLNNRLDYLIRVAKQVNPAITEADCRNVLIAIWDRVFDLERSNRWRPYFRSVNLPGMGSLYRLDFNYWEITSPITHEQAWFICDTCRGISLHNLRGVCPTYRCTGKLHPCDPRVVHKSNHYFSLYANLLPIKVKAAEHTAQLSPEAAAELQSQFLKGEVNILSCSTTFEMGVDVGELEAVFMRNVPPSAANYIQRAGRAGRRANATAFVLTFAQRRSHDLDHYREPWRMVSGRVNAPFFALENTKIVSRHVYATALSQFWRDNQDAFGKVEDFFFPKGMTAGVEKFIDFLEEHPSGLQQSLKIVVPEGLHQHLALEDWGWTKQIIDPDEGILPRVNEEVRYDVQELEDLRTTLVVQGKRVDHLTRLIKTIKSKELIGFLSNRNVLPKYGFPVDVVELQILHHSDEAHKLRLNRDLRIALAEYAPDGEIVAGGKLWKSRYIKRLPEREWERYRYGICPECKSYYSRRFELSEDLRACPRCQKPYGREKGVFVVPAFGFVADPTFLGSPGEAKPARTYASRVYFSGDQAAEGSPVKLALRHNVELRATPAAQGRLAVINDAGGYGFRVCRRCGYAGVAKKVPTTHKTPWGNECTGKFEQRLSLGHEFETDIIKMLFLNYTDNRSAFWYSLLYALLEGISLAMDIERQDLDGCLYPVAGDPSCQTLVIFDDVPGGAGHVNRLASQEALNHVLKVTLDRLRKCECGGENEDASCSGCLRNYRNQFCHEDLKRGMVIGFLSRLLE